MTLIGNAEHRIDLMGVAPRTFDAGRTTFQYQPVWDADVEETCERLGSALDRMGLTAAATSPRRRLPLQNGDDMPDAIPARHDGHAVAWLPVWDARREALTAYWLTPTSPDGASSIPAYDVSWRDARVHSDVDFLALDLANLDRVIEEAGRCLDAGLHCLAGYSVHSTTLQDRQRRQGFLARFNEIPERLRPHIFARIAEIEPGTPPATIAEWVKLLRPVNNEVAIELHESEHALESLELTGATTASFTLSSRQHDRQSKEYYARHIQRWAARLRRQHILFRLDNIEDPGLLALALAGGAEFLTSERCWPRVAGPAGVRKYPRSQLGRVA